MYMIWLVTAMNGQQRPVAILSLVLPAGQAVTATATATRAFATIYLRPIAVTIPASLSGHFYTCRTEC